MIPAIRSHTLLLPRPEIRLRAREVQVMDLIAEGLPNKTIAHRLHIAETTVKKHVSNIFIKTGATNRTEIAVRVLRGR